VVAFDTCSLARSELGCLLATLVRGQCWRRYFGVDRCGIVHAKLTASAGLVSAQEGFLSEFHSGPGPPMAAPHGGFLEWEIFEASGRAIRDRRVRQASC
jgi:hypothetical protein